MSSNPFLTRPSLFSRIGSAWRKFWAVTLALDEPFLGHFGGAEQKPIIQGSDGHRFSDYDDSMMPPGVIVQVGESSPVPVVTFDRRNGRLEPIRNTCFDMVEAASPVAAVAVAPAKPVAKPRAKRAAPKRKRSGKK